MQSKFENLKMAILKHRGVEKFLEVRKQSRENENIDKEKAECEPNRSVVRHRKHHMRKQAHHYHNHHYTIYGQ